MSLIGLIIYLFVLWGICLIFKWDIKDFFAWLFNWRKKDERNKRIDLIFQTFQDPVEEAYRKDPEIFKKMFAGVEPIKNLPSDIFKVSR